MSWSIKGLAGPLENQEFELKAGMTLGRRGDIAVNEAKASSLHATIHQAPDGTWRLEDNHSKNGTRVSGERISSLPMHLGMIFYIGDQGFEVIDTTSESEPMPVPAPMPSPRPRPANRHYWYELLGRFLEENLEKFHDKPHSVTPLNPALILDFIRGPQVNSRWILGYGPRKVGPISLDLPILEPAAPPLCFEILPSAQGILFRTGLPGLVKLNRQEIDSQVLRVGDTIQIIDTVIEVDFTE